LEKRSAQGRDLLPADLSPIQVVIAASDGEEGGFRDGRVKSLGLVEGYALIPLPVDNQERRPGWFRVSADS
jgi:hypothetical protein